MTRQTIGTRLTKAGSMVLAGVLATLALTACGDDGTSKTTDGLTVVKVGTLRQSSDVGLFIAADLGYFKDEGIKVEFTNFASSTDMIAPLGQGRLDVGAGGIAASTFNAVGNDIGIRMVADKGSNRPGYGYPFVIRSALADKVHDFADLKGMTLNVAAKGTSPEVCTAAAAKAAGLNYNKDIKAEHLNFPQMLPAMQNGEVDAGILAEPFATKGIADGSLKLLSRSDQICPDQEFATLLYGEKFISESRSVGEAFMAAYIKGLRYYGAALKGGHIVGTNASTVVDILSKHTALKDKKTWSLITAQAADPDGKLNLENLADCLSFWRDQGYIKSDVSVADAVDTSFVDAALKKLGKQ